MIIRACPAHTAYDGLEATPRKVYLHDTGALRPFAATFEDTPTRQHTLCCDTCSWVLPAASWEAGAELELADASKRDGGL